MEPFERTLAAARAGAGWALGELFRDLHPRLLRYFRSFDPRDSDGLASDTWLRVVRGLERFRGDERDLRAFAFTIARERLTDPSRPRPDGPGTNGSEDPEVTGPVIHLDDPSLADLGTEAALARITLLPAEQAEVVLLRVVGGLSVDEVARVVDKRPGTVRLVQQAALSRLAQSTESVDR
jgi:RNA polymerase sigma-70 factor (ECF subfamily)